MKDLTGHTPKRVAKEYGGKAVPTWRKQEARVAKRSGGRIQPASGATMFRKGDVTAGEFLIEAKSTDADSLGVKRKWLEKISDEARVVGKTPALAVTFASVPFGVEKDWVMVPASFLFGESG